MKTIEITAHTFVACVMVALVATAFGITFGVAHFVITGVVFVALGVASALLAGVAWLLRR
jgi:hypothetical protein